MVIRADTIIDKKLKVHINMTLYLVIENMSYGQLKGDLFHSRLLCMSNEKHLKHKYTLNYKNKT